MSEQALDLNLIIESEMLSHPVLFTHENPKEIAIIGENTQAVVAEALKHSSIAHVHHVSNAHDADSAILDQRIIKHNAQIHSWLEKCEANLLDVIIYSSDSEQLIPENLADFYRIMHASGLLIYLCYLPLMQIKTLLPLWQAAQKVGFTNVQTLHFPLLQGNRTAILITKKESFRRIREKDIYNRNFATKYYNLDIHKAALALPEYLRKELEI